MFFSIPSGLPLPSHNNKGPSSLNVGLAPSLHHALANDLPSVTSASLPGHTLPPPGKLAINLVLVSYQSVYSANVSSPLRDFPKKKKKSLSICRGKKKNYRNHKLHFQVLRNVICNSRFHCEGPGSIPDRNIVLVSALRSYR
jgi:hypothetical protein